MIPRDQLHRMRSGVREAVVRAGGTMRGAARPTLMVLLCAGALTPVVGAAIIAEGVLTASLGVVGGMAGNILSNVISSTTDRLRRDGGASLPPADVERELITRIEAVLAGDPEKAHGLRQEIADLLRRIGAVQQAVEAAVEVDDEDLQATLIAAFGDLADQFTEFRFVLTDIRTTADQLQQQIYREDAERRADRDRNRQQATQLQLIHEQLLLIERNTREAESTSVIRSRGRWQEDSPYRGLAPFLENEAEVFYGRDRLTTELTTRVGQCAFGTGLLVITGPSGAGKSSLLRAGLFPAIARGVLPVTGSEHWPRLVMTPGSEPLAELAVHVSAISGVDAGSVRRELVEDPQSAGLLARQAVLSHAATLPMDRREEVSASGRLIVVVDQFEELFTLTGEDDPEGTRRAFIAALRSMSESADGGPETPSALVIVAVRGDFFDRCAGYSEFTDPLRDGPFLVGPMTEGELRQAITGPATAAGLELEDGLADAILADLRNTPVDRDFAVGALPLLSQAMLLTWQHRDGDRLTHRGYALTGGVPNVVETSAEEVYEALTPSQQRIARDMFRRLTTVTREGQLARQAVDRADLRKAASNDEAAEADKADTVLDAFTSKRLIVVADDHAEIAHDSVLRAWPRLRSWFEDDQAGRILYSQLIEDAADWQAHERDPSFLYRGTRLVAVNQAKAIWYTEPDRYPILDDTVKEFLDHARRTDSRASKIRTLAIASLSVLLAMALIATVLAVNANKSANAQRLLAVSRQLVAQSQILATSDPVISQLSAAGAWDIAPGASHVRVAMLRSLANPLRKIFPAANTVAFSPDSALLATAANDGLVRLWDSATGDSVATLDAGEAVFEVAFGSNGRLVSAGDLGSVTLWDIATYKKVATLHGHRDEVHAIAFSPDGKRFATGGSEVLQWDAFLGKRIGALKGKTATVEALAYSPDGTILATGEEDGSLRLWDVATGRQSGILLRAQSRWNPENSVSDVDFSAGGAMVAAVAPDDTVRVWNTNSRELLAVLSGRPYDISAAVFSPDGSVLTASDTDGAVHVWDASTWLRIARLDGYGTVAALTYSPDGTRLAVLGDVVRLWANPTGRRVAHVPDIPSPFENISSLFEESELPIEFELSPDGSVFVMGSFSQHVDMWNTRTRKRRTLKSVVGISHLAVGPNGSVLAGASDRGVQLWNTEADSNPITLPGSSYPVRFDGMDYGASPDFLVFGSSGKYVAAGRNFSTRDDSSGWWVRVWDAKTRRIMMTRGGRDDVLGPLFLSPDGAVLAAANLDGQVHLLPVQTGESIINLRAGISLSDTMAFSPDGTVLAAGNRDGVVQRWYTASGASLSTLPGHTRGVHALAYSRYGVMAVGAGDGTVWLWDTATGEFLGELQGHADAVLRLAFRGDGALVSVGADDSVREWDLSYLKDPYRALCERAGRAMTRAEWNKYVGDLPFQEVCPQG